MPTATATANILRILSLFLIATAILVLLHIAKVPAEGLLMRSFLDSSHVLVFAIVVLLLFSASKAIPNLTTTRRAAITLVVTLLLGIVSEAAQIPGPRDASLQDLLSNWFGAAGALLIAVAFVPKSSAHRKSRIFFSLAGLAVLVLSIFPLLKVSAAFAERVVQRPTLLTFDSYFARTFVRPQNSTLAIIESPSGGETVGWVSLNEGAWPGLVIHDIWPDWRNHSELVVDLLLDTDSPSQINFRVHDRKHQAGEQPHNDRFNVSFTLPPGRHTVRIPLETLKHAPMGRQMDLANIAGIAIYCSKKEAGKKFGLISIRLNELLDT